MKDKCKCNTCDVDFNEDNGYKYVLDELKATRKHLDEIIDVIEKRMKKDAIIDEVLNTEYDDEDDDININLSELREEDVLTIKNLLRIMQLQNQQKNMKGIRQCYPWTLHPNTSWKTYYY